MKKVTTLLLGIWGGLIALTSCSDSIYHEIDEQNNDMYAPSTFNNDSIGHAHGDNPQSGLVWPGGNYFSPWDIWFRQNSYGTGNLQPSYVISNGNVEQVTDYNIEVFAYIGLAYFDGLDDGLYYDSFEAFHNPPGLIDDLANGNYPNLYANGHEVGNLVKTVVPIISNAYPDPSHAFRMEDQFDHLPMGFSNRFPQFPHWWPFFDFAGTITPQERDLLRQYGKVFFYEVNVYDKTTNAPVLLNHIMHPEIETIHDPNMHWVRVEDQVGNHIHETIPLLGVSTGLYYYYDNTLPSPGTVWDLYNTAPGYNKCDSREVVFDIPQSLKLHEMPIPGSASSKLLLEIWSSTPYLWINSALRLSVQN